MIKFVIKVTTKDNLELTGVEMDAPSEDVFNTFVDGMYKSIGTGNFMLTDEDGDIIIIPQALISESIVQVIKIN